MSAYPSLFQNNPDVRALLPHDARMVALAHRLHRRAYNLSYALPFVEAEDAHPAPSFPLIARMCQKAGLTGPVGIRPYLYLSEAERQEGRLLPRQVAVMSSGMSAKPPFLNKQWFPERYQAVVTALRGQFDFLQIGDASDPPLEGALDLRGKTSLRQSAAILSQSLLFVGQVGLLMHLARAVDCRAVIVFGGREAPRQSGYACNENLYTPLPCAPCWKQNACDFGRECLRRITPESVIEAVERQAARFGEPLVTDTYPLTAAPAARPARAGQGARNAASGYNGETFRQTHA